MIEVKDIRAAESEWRSARADVEKLSGAYVVAGLGLLTLLTVPAILLGDLVASGWVRYPATEGFSWCSRAHGVRDVVPEPQDEHATFELAHALEDRLAGALEVAKSEAHEREVQVRRQEFESRLANALEMADGEAEVIAAVERALALILPDSPVEILLADNSHAHLTRMGTWSPTGEPPRCGVDSPDHCPAARHAQVQRFADSEDLAACPKLRDRPQGRCSAVCVPVAIMGRTVGVIHTTGEPDNEAGEAQVQDLETLSNLAGNRIGLLRMVAETQLQASTDSLTGLLNRRSLESKVRSLRAEHTSFTIAMADLDRFKELNDTYGHETGDRALRLFAETLRGSLRSHDIVSRQGGEEFAVVMPSCTASQARACSRRQPRSSTVPPGAGLPNYTASFGVVEAGEDEDLPTILARADAALFQAKRGVATGSSCTTGRVRWC